MTSPSNGLPAGMSNVPIIGGQRQPKATHVGANVAVLLKHQDGNTPPLMPSEEEGGMRAAFLTGDDLLAAIRAIVHDELQRHGMGAQVGNERAPEGHRPEKS